MDVAGFGNDIQHLEARFGKRQFEAAAALAACIDDQDPDGHALRSVRRERAAFKPPEQGLCRLLQFAAFAAVAALVPRLRKAADAAPRRPAASDRARWQQTGQRSAPAWCAGALRRLFSTDNHCIYRYFFVWLDVCFNPWEFFVSGAHSTSGGAGITAGSRGRT
ncbi:MAG: hypothetical protein NVS9B10_12300 [Nevskia sp.]